MTETKTELDTSIEEVTHAVAEITKMDTVIAELHEKYDKVIFDVDTPAGLKAAKEARKDIRDPRYLIEKMRKGGKAPILALGRQLDGRAADMTNRLLNLETPIDDTIKEEESRVERERQEKIDAELKRVATIQEHISDIRNGYEKFTRFDVTADQIQVQITDLEELEINEAMFQEFLQQGNDAKSAVLVQLRSAHAAAVAREDEKRKAEEARSELEALKKENEAREAKEREEREKAEAVAQKKREAEEKKQRIELEAQRKKQAEEQAHIDAENKRIADERAAFEKEQREEKERKEVEEKAQARAKAEAAAAAKKAKYPGNAKIVGALCEHFRVSTEIVLKWLPQLREESSDE